MRNRAVEQYNNIIATYPIIVFDVDTSSFANKVFQSIFKAPFFCCQVWGSLLMENKVIEWLACRLLHSLVPRLLCPAWEPGNKASYYIDWSHIKDTKGPIIFAIDYMNTGAFLRGQLKLKQALQYYQ